jgi:hypothetical protein
MMNEKRAIEIEQAFPCRESPKPDVRAGRELLMDARNEQRRTAYIFDRFDLL